MIRRADHHCVDVFASQQFAEVNVCRAAFVRRHVLLLGVAFLDDPLRVLTPLIDDVADRDDLRVIRPHEPLQVATRLNPDTDEAQSNPFARRREPTRRRGQNHWPTGRSSGRGQELTTRQAGHEKLHFGRQ